MNGLEFVFFLLTSGTCFMELVEISVLQLEQKERKRREQPRNRSYMQEKLSKGIKLPKLGNNIWGGGACRDNRLKSQQLH